jgi:small multidrug resistance pump
MPTYALLALCILAEVAATTALKASEGFTRLLPSAITIVGYGTAFYCLSLVMRTMPVGVVYAIWSGVGIVLISVAGWALFGQKLDAAAVTGIGFIIAGVLIINLLSNSAVH